MLLIFTIIIIIIIFITAIAYFCYKNNKSTLSQL